MSSIREVAESIADGWLRGEKNNDELVDAIEQALHAERKRRAKKAGRSCLPRSIAETAERICRHNLDSERVSVTQFCDIQAAIEQALRDERERAAKIAETHCSADCDGPDCGVVIARAIRKED